MFGVGMGGAVRQYIAIKGVQMNLAAVEAFMNDLYANAELSLPSEFDPVEEVIRVVTVLREQGSKV